MPKADKIKETFKPYQEPPEEIEMTPPVPPQAGPSRQVEQNPPQYQIPVSELIKEAARIKEFTGKDGYALTSFIREVELFLPLFQADQALYNFILQRSVINKIQGDALQTIRTLGTNPTWEQIKVELTRSFGVRETYHHLYHQAVSLKNFNNVSEYFYKLKDILDKLNSKYEQDAEKPMEFSPSVNESIILKTFINGIDPSLASIILSRNINTLRGAFFTLEENGMVRQSRFNRNTNYSTQKGKGHNHNKNINGSTYNQYQNRERNSEQFRPNYNQNFNRTSGQSRNNSNQYFSPNSRQNRNNNNRNSVQFSNRNRVEPMEVGHLQREVQEEVNFQLPPLKHTYR